MQGRAAYGSVRILVKASNPPVSKVRQFLHSKPSYTMFTLATRKFRKMKAFAGIKNEKCCEDLAYVGKQIKDSNGVKCLLVRQDLFDSTINANGTKTKDSKETVIAILTVNTKRIEPKKSER